MLSTKERAGRAPAGCAGPGGGGASGGATATGAAVGAARPPASAESDEAQRPVEEAAAALPEEPNAEAEEGAEEARRRIANADGEAERDAQHRATVSGGRHGCADLDRGELQLRLMASSLLLSLSTATLVGRPIQPTSCPRARVCCAAPSPLQNFLSEEEDAARSGAQPKLEVIAGDALMVEVGARTPLGLNARVLPCGRPGLVFLDEVAYGGGDAAGPATSCRRTWCRSATTAGST